MVRGLAFILGLACCLGAGDTLFADDVSSVSPSDAIEATTKAAANEVENRVGSMEAGATLLGDKAPRWASVQMLLAMSVLSIAPAVLLMTTSFVRISVVLSMLRHAIGAQQAPSNQVVMALSLFLSGLIMTPVWTAVHRDALAPYLAGDSSMTAQEAWLAGVRPVREFMSRQIIAAGNSEEVWLFYRYLPESQTRPTPSSYDEIPLQALLPAFLISELKIAFLIGFQVYLPFVILDLVVASVTTSVGMVMLPPAMISLPFKLMLFVMVDGWRLVVSMLLSSFA